MWSSTRKTVCPYESTKAGGVEVATPFHCTIWFATVKKIQADRFDKNANKTLKRTVEQKSDHHPTWFTIIFISISCFWWDIHLEPYVSVRCIHFYLKKLLKTNAPTNTHTLTLDSYVHTTYHLSTLWPCSSTSTGLGGWGQHRQGISKHS